MKFGITPEMEKEQNKEKKQQKGFGFFVTIFSLLPHTLEAENRLQKFSRQVMVAMLKIKVGSVVECK